MGGPKTAAGARPARHGRWRRPASAAAAGSSHASDSPMKTSLGFCLVGTRTSPSPARARARPPARACVAISVPHYRHREHRHRCGEEAPGGGQGARCRLPSPGVPARPGAAYGPGPATPARTAPMPARSGRVRAAREPRRPVPPCGKPSRQRRIEHRMQGQRRWVIRPQRFSYRRGRHLIGATAALPMLRVGTPGVPQLSSPAARQRPCRPNPRLDRTLRAVQPQS